MDESVLEAFKTLAEPLVSLSVGHLTGATRHKLATDQLSVSAYPSGFGGFVYVGIPRYDTPEEPDLAMLFEIAERSGVAWLNFDVSGATVDGLPLYPG
jgi:hypothetical protein